jgi:hypothetical protein
MKLIELLTDSSLEELERLAHEHARAEDQLSRPQLLATIESVLRSYRFVQDYLLNRQPPTFAIVTLLLDAPDLTVPTTALRDLVLLETTRICDAIDSGELLKRDEQLRVYRRVLYQARSNDMRIDSSESAILGVLRQELGVSQVEHFLIEHHADLREFWRRETAFEQELEALRSAGLVFTKDEHTLIPEDLVPVVRQVLGIDMARHAARRLFQQLSGQDLRDALDAIEARLSGSKEERIDRLVEHMRPPRAVLSSVGLETLRNIASEIGAPTSGAKADLVERIVAHVAAGRDIRAEPEREPEPIAEPRRLSEERFGYLFSYFRGHELADILGEFNLRRWGTKEFQGQTLWEAQRAETTLLGCLSNLELEVILRRVGLKTGGSKADRIERLVEYFATLEATPLQEQRVAADVPGDTEA